MVRPAQTARSERTRDALREAALMRFMGQGFEETSAEQIASDAGVSLRTFYRHFSSKHDLLFADYDAGLRWFRAALDARPASESIIESVRAAVLAFPYDVEAVTKIAALRDKELDANKMLQRMQVLEADVADAIEAHLQRRSSAAAGTVDQQLHITVTARCIAAAVHGALEVWTRGEERSLAELARLCHSALDALHAGITDTQPGNISS